MNRIHKSIFNEQTGTYVAVSENTSNKGKKGNKVLAATAVSVALGLGVMGSAQAQLVDACAGVSLPKSVVTQIVGQVVNPIYSPIETTVNGLLGPVSSLLSFVGLGGIVPGPLNLNLSQILADAAAGDPITLGVLNENGSVVGPTDACDLSADSLALTDPAGIAIGGNKITGLGSDAAGAAAVSSAADFTSIALGNFSQATQSKAIAFGEAAKAFGEGSIAVGADALSANLNATALGNAVQATGVGSTALGAGAQANAANSVALGNGSVATAANTVSVGSVGNERKITNVADGTVAAGSTDAITGGQLHQLSLSTGLGLVQQADNLAPITVGKDSAGTEVDFANVAAQTRKLTGIADGDLSATSTDAVTGKQLNATNESISALSNNAVQYDGVDKSIVTLGGATGTTLDNVKAGAVNATSTEAINGAQLYRSTSDLADALGGNAIVDADGNLTNVGYTFISGTQNSVGEALLNLDTRVDGNTTNISNLMNGAAGLVLQANGTAPITVGAATAGTSVDFTGTAGVRKLTGLANGNVVAGSADAMTGGQLFASSQSVADALGGGSTVNTTTGAVSTPGYELDDGTNTGNKVTVTGVEGALTNLDGRVTSNTGRITTLEGDITNITNGTLGIVKQNATTRVITVGGETDGAEVNFRNSGGDARKLTGIANGNVAAGSADAVTGDQLNTTNLAVSAALTALGGGASIDVNGVVTGPVYNIGGTSFDNVGGALTNLDDRVTSNTNRITTVEGDITNIKGDITNIQGDITDIKNGTAGIVKFDAAADKITVGSEVAGSSVDFTGKDSSGAAIKRKLTGIADGELSATSSDAVTGKQLNATNQQVKASSQFTASALGGGAEAKDDGTFVNPLYALQEVQQDGSKKAVTFNNVGGALTSLNTSVASLQDQINNNTSIGLVRQDPGSRVISVGGNTDGTEVNFANSNGEARVISGVAAGKGPTDAVNVQQAQDMISGATSTLRGEIRRAEKRADAGTAAATAVATLGQAYQPGQSAFSVGGGTWRGEAGYAMGVSTVSENGKWLLKGAVNGSGRGGAGGGASVTYLW